MNWDIIEGKWGQLKGEAKKRWAKLTDDDLGMISAKRDKLVGKIQERYGVAVDDAEREVDEWIDKLEAPKGEASRSGERGATR